MDSQQFICPLCEKEINEETYVKKVKKKEPVIFEKVEIKRFYEHLKQYCERANGDCSRCGLGIFCGTMPLDYEEIILDGAIDFISRGS